MILMYTESTESTESIVDFLASQQMLNLTFDTEVQLDPLRDAKMEPVDADTNPSQCIVSLGLHIVESASPCHYSS